MDRISDDSGRAAERAEDEAVDMAGETTAAATGPAEIGAATSETDGASVAPPVGADTMVKVADESDSN